MDVESLLANIPLPTPEEMHSRRLLARQYTLVFLRKGPVSRDDEEREEARLLAEADPKVKAGYLTVEAIPWMAVPSE